MGKPTGFLDYERRECPAQAPLERVKHWNEFHSLLPAEERRVQGGRCMECGVPFCQSGVELGGMFTGCPLHNLVPEWNDLIWQGSPTHALERLLKTNSFPEFTGRVCPALCEAACTCSLHGDAVTVRQNELGIVEEAFSQGRMTPRPPTNRSGKKVAVVGSGPAGLAAAQRLNSRGHTVTVFERDDRPGGLLMYGIPNMKLEKRIVERRVDLMRAEGVRFLTGTEVGRDVAPDELRRDFDAVVLCVGAKCPRDLDVPGRSADGVSFAVDYLTRCTKALLEGKLNTEAAGKDVLIVGGGDTGNDCVASAIRQGCRSVVQLEMMPCPPETRTQEDPWPQWPRIRKTDYGQQEAIALFGRDPRLYQTTVKELLTDGEGGLRGAVTVRLEPKRDEKTGRSVMVPVPGSETELPCQMLLIAAGFLGPEPYVADAFGLETDGRGNLKTNSYAAVVPGVFAAGDARRGQSLVVWAIREGQECAQAVDEFLIKNSYL